MTDTARSSAELMAVYLSKYRERPSFVSTQSRTDSGVCSGTGARREGTRPLHDVLVTYGIN